MTLQQCVRDSVDVIRIADIPSDRDRGSSSLGDPGDNFLRGGQIQILYQEMRPIAGQCTCDRGTDSAAGAGNNRCSTVQRERFRLGKRTPSEVKKELEEFNG